MTTPVTPAVKLPRPLGEDVFASVTLDGSGNGRVTIGPTRVREHWQLGYAAVSVTFPAGQGFPTKDAQCNLYIGAGASAGHLVSATATGSSGDTCGLGGMDIQSGTVIIAVWTGGDAGQVATLSLGGTYTIGSPYGI
jgi:hypothetical protein